MTTSARVSSNTKPYDTTLAISRLHPIILNTSQMNNIGSGYRLLLLLLTSWHIFDRALRSQPFDTFADV